MSSRTGEFNPKHHAKCGLYCPSCRAYITTQEDPSKLDVMARRFNRTAEDYLCDGCGSDRVSYYCRNCDMKTCANAKGFQSCSECDEMPCDKIISFQNTGAPHRLEVVDSLKLRRECGSDRWQEEQESVYTCPNCGAVNTAYDLRCRKCGNDPGNAFVKKHKDAVMKHLGVLSVNK
jgi:predicted RNA-binding Zn-ribbon protein involved in translation (DUF1610 family)